MNEKQRMLVEYADQVRRGLTEIFATGGEPMKSSQSMLARSMNNLLKQLDVDMAEADEPSPKEVVDKILDEVRRTEELNSIMPHKITLGDAGMATHRLQTAINRMINQPSQDTMSREQCRDSLHLLNDWAKLVGLGNGQPNGGVSQADFDELTQRVSQLHGVVDTLDKSDQNDDQRIKRLEGIERFDDKRINSMIELLKTVDLCEKNNNARIGKLSKAIDDCNTEQMDAAAAQHATEQEVRQLAERSIKHGKSIGQLFRIVHRDRSRDRLKTAVDSWPQVGPNDEPKCGTRAVSAEEIGKAMDELRTDPEAEASPMAIDEVRRAFPGAFVAHGGMPNEFIVNFNTQARAEFDLAFPRLAGYAGDESDEFITKRGDEPS